MLHLLQLEWKKFKSNSVTNLLGLLFLIIFPTSIFLCKELFKEKARFPGDSTHADIFQFPGIWEWMGYVGSWTIFFFIGFIGIYIVTSEIRNKTLRQNIITGMTRNEYFLGKLYYILVITIIATVLYTICAMLIGIAHTETWTISNLWDNDLASLRYFLMTLGFLSFGLCLGFVIRNGGFAIFLYLSFVLFIEPLIRYLLFYKVYQTRLVNFLPMNLFEDLMPNPKYKLTENLPENTLPEIVQLLSNNEAILGAMFYICLFLGIAYWSFKRKDI